MSSPGPLPIGGQELDTPPEKIDKSLQKANKKLRGDIKQMEMKIKAMQVELTKSLQMKDRLEALCRELQKQNKYIKAESSAKIQEANARGKELASEVQNNMGFMKSINENLAAISSESLTVKRENDELAKKIGVLKGHYEEREQILQEALKDTNESLIELGEAKLENAQEKEKLISEMQKLADALLQSREQVKDSKLTELSLREMVQSYEDKFNGLQKALKDTNGSYEEFRTEMTKVTSRTKQLEKETTKWQQRWEESNIALGKMRENYNKVNEDLAKSQDSLEKMKGLCRTLHNENRDLQGELNGQKGGVTPSSSSGGLSVNAAETLATINNEAATAAAVAQQISQAGLTEEKIAEESTTHRKSPEEVKTTVVDTKNQEQGVDAIGNAPELVAVAATPPKETSLAPQLSPTSPGSSNPSTPTPGDGGDAASSKGKKNKKRKNNKK